jgi:hypothetical protein
MLHRLAPKARRRSSDAAAAFLQALEPRNLKVHASYGAAPGSPEGLILPSGIFSTPLGKSPTRNSRVNLSSAMLSDALDAIGAWVCSSQWGTAFQFNKNFT